MKIITTTENIKQLLKEQRELCANRAMKEKLSMYYAKDIRKIICSAPEPEIKKYKILSEAPDEIRDVMDNKAKKEPCTHMRKQRSKIYKRRMVCVDCGELL